MKRMKKLTAALLAVLLLISCVGFSACGFIFGLWNGLLDGDDGNNGGTDGTNGHTHKFDSYFTYSQCSVAGCNVVGRNGSENTYAKNFKYTLTNAQNMQYNALYDEILTCIDDGDDYRQFEKLYLEYLDAFDYVGQQYQIASVLYDVEGTDTRANFFKVVSRLYNQMYANYYKLYGLVHESNYATQFFNGWSDDEVALALYYAQVYGNSAENNNAVDRILQEYEDYLNDIGGAFSDVPSQRLQQLNKVGEMYGKLVNANNNIAVSAGYDDYMVYAYANEYNRDYTPSYVAETMRNYVKLYIAPIFTKVAMQYANVVRNSKFNTYADLDFYCGLMEDSLFANTKDESFGRVRSAISYVGEYFKYMKRSAIDTGGQKFDFEGAVEDLFKNGNYFTGEYQGAYTWWFDAIDKPILYFGLGDGEYVGYDTAFTFVHEFGHYYENLYNGNLRLSYDQDETHSQGNEMLFLAWLAQNKPSGVTNGFEMVELAQLFDMLGNIVISTAVDEFEQAAYSGEYNGKAIGVSYDELFSTILHSYSGADAYLNTDYWTYVVFSSPAYYVSYAMSALPSLELYVKAKSVGLYTARECYVKLFTFANGHRFVATDKNGNAYLRDSATYETILKYCGLQTPFELGLYTTLQSYFATRTDLK